VSIHSGRRWRNREKSGFDEVVLAVRLRKRKFERRRRR